MVTERIGAVTGKADLESATEVLLRAFAGQENVRMGKGYARALLRTFVVEPLRDLAIASEGRRVVGFTAGERGDLQTARYRSLRLHAGAAFLRRPWLLFDESMIRMAGNRLKASNTLVPPDSWFLALVGVDPDFARLGIGKRLLNAFEDEGRRRGFAQATLFVRESNDPARSLYEGCGWTTGAEPDRGRVLYMKSLG